MKRLKAAMCAVLAGLMLAGCGKVEEGGRSERPEPAVELAKYIVAEAEYPVYPAEPRFEDYMDDGEEG